MNNITILDWILIITFCILFLVSIYLIFLVFFNNRKAGKLIFSIKDIKYKNQRLILVGILIIIIFNCFQFIKNPEMGTLLATSMLVMMFSANVVLQYYGIGIYEKGVMFSGILHNWEKVKKYSLDTNLLVMNIQNKKGSNEFQYNCYVNDTTNSEIHEFLNSKINKII